MYMRLGYEEEKKKLDARIQEEKTRTDKRYNELLDEYEMKYCLQVGSRRRTTSLRMRRRTSGACAMAL